MLDCAEFSEAAYSFVTPYSPRYLFIMRASTFACPRSGTSRIYASPKMPGDSKYIAFAASEHQ